jgi:DNA-binding response OmpR family regulator
MTNSVLQPSCMIVEDQVLIGMPSEASLEEMGFQIEDPFISNAQALGWLSSETPDVALLDFMINDGTSLEMHAP